jgi:hypothetical protein
MLENDVREITPVCANVDQGHRRCQRQMRHQPGIEAKPAVGHKIVHQDLLAQPA